MNNYKRKNTFTGWLCHLYLVFLSLIKGNKNKYNDCRN